jgi:hypothetical protein
LVYTLGKDLCAAKAPEGNWWLASVLSGYNLTEPFGQC